MISSGTIAERYEIRRLLGSGGMGQVYLAFDQLLRRPVALKLFGLGSSPSAEEAFLREARMAARLSHPNVVTVHDVGTADNHAFIAMEYVEGTSLAELIDKPQPWQSVLAMAREILKGLAYAHGRGVVHRDIKPSNLIRTEDGRVVILDLGISYALEATTRTAPDGLMGTPAYMAPEQIRGEAIDGRTDLFSLGVVLYQLLAAQGPFQAPGLSETLAQVLHRIPPAPSASQPLPQELDRFVLRLLAKSPGKRYASAEDALVALDRCSDSDLTIPVRPRPGGMNSRISLVLSGGLVLVVVSSFLAVLFSAPVNGPDPLPTPSATPPTATTPQAPPELQLQAIPLLVLSPRLIIEALPSMAPAVPVVPTPQPPPVEAAPPPTPAASPTPVPMASLRILVDQPAHIFVDGKLVGDSDDLELQLKPGAHKIAAESLDGSQRAQRSVKLSADMPLTVRLNFAPPPPGTVRITPPERTFVDVHVDGVFLKGCPCPPISLAVGVHRLRFVNQEAGFDRTLEVVVKSGQEAQVDLGISPGP